MNKLIDYLFNKKENKIINQCDGILENIRAIQDIISDSKGYISNMQENVRELQDGIKAMQDNIKEYQRLNEQTINLYDEMRVILDELVGDKE